MRCKQHRRYIIAGVLITDDKILPLSLKSAITPCLRFLLFRWHRRWIYRRYQRHRRKMRFDGSRPSESVLSNPKFLEDFLSLPTPLSSFLAYFNPEEWERLTQTIINLGAGIYYAEQWELSPYTVTCTRCELIGWTNVVIWFLTNGVRPPIGLFLDQVTFYFFMMCLANRRCFNRTQYCNNWVSPETYSI